MLSVSKGIWGARLALLLMMLCLWELAGRSSLGGWTSQPGLVFARLVEMGSGISLHVLTTIAEVLCGLAIGSLLGVVLGMLFGYCPRAAALGNPLVVALNSLPVVAMAPLLIMWFGLGMLSKIVMVALVSFFILFFNAYSGVLAIDPALIDALRLMGAQGHEQFRKLILPASLTWIISGLKSALPYSLIAATVGEMLLSTHGLGFLLTSAASQFDMAGFYLSLCLLMVVGIVLNGALLVAEACLLKWRTV